MTPYTTFDLGKAAYLSYGGVELLGCVPSKEKGRLSFVFQDSPERQGLEEKWDKSFAKSITHQSMDGAEDLVSAAHYERFRRQCLRKVHEPVE